MTTTAPTGMTANGLRVELKRTGQPVVDDVNLTLAPGEIVGLVGESGSGKTTTALALFGFAEDGLRYAGGSVCINGEELTSPGAMRAARGKAISYVPQNPGTALNPSMRVAQAINEMVESHRSRKPALAETEAALENVGLPGSRDFRQRFPHQLSGGQQQRVCIASALAVSPSVVVLDEPTTGLDVLTQDRILKELLRLRDEHGVSMLYITHDLAVVAQIASRIAVMYAGRLVELGPARQILRYPRHPYTRGLMAATPDHLKPRVLKLMAGMAPAVGDRPSGCVFAARCPHRVHACETQLPELELIGDGHWARCIEWARLPDAHVDVESVPPESLAPTEFEDAPVLDVAELRAEHKSRYETTVAASGVSFSVRRGGCVAIVGESGSGKTTIARTVAGLHPLAGGELLLGGEALPALARNRSLEQRRRLQIVFQNPAEALNPRKTVGSAISRPIQVLRKDLNKAQVKAEVDELLDAVRLPARVFSRYPRELSGGERQRVAIARALAAKPDVLICDEVTSALDVSVQAVVLELLRTLRSELGVAMVFITHDVGVVAAIAEHVLVLHQGEVCEYGDVADILDSPQHDYTRRLVASSPSLSAAIAAWDAEIAP